MLKILLYALCPRKETLKQFLDVLETERLVCFWIVHLYFYAIIF